MFDLFSRNPNTILSQFVLRVLEWAVDANRELMEITINLGGGLPMTTEFGVLL